MARIDQQKLAELAILGSRVGDVLADPAVRKSGRQFRHDTATALRSGSAFLGEAHSAWRRSAPASAPNCK